VLEENSRRQIHGYRDAIILEKLRFQKNRHDTPAPCSNCAGLKSVLKSFVFVRISVNGSPNRTNKVAWRSADEAWTLPQQNFYKPSCRFDTYCDNRIKPKSSDFWSQCVWFNFYLEWSGQSWHNLLPGVFFTFQDNEPSVWKSSRRSPWGRGYMMLRFIPRALSWGRKKRDSGNKGWAYHFWTPTKLEINSKCLVSRCIILPTG